MTIANTTILLKKSGVPGNVPSSLTYGELGINYHDGKLFYLNSVGQIVQYQSGSGGSSDSFATINVNSTLILATSPTDTLSFVGSNGILVQANTQSKTISVDGNYIITLAQAAFDRANTGSSSSLDQYARNTANTALSVGQGAFDLANSISKSGSSNQIVNGNSSFVIDSSGVVTLNNKTTEFANASFISNPSIDTIIDTFPLSNKTAKYIIQAIAGNEIHTKEVIVINNGSVANTIQYNDVLIGSSLMTINTNLVGNNVVLSVQTTKVNTVVDFVRKTLFKSNLSPSVPTGDLGLVTQMVSLIFDNGYDLQTVTNSYDYGYLA
jgi:hypothetical protein